MNGSINQSGFWIRIFSVLTQQERLALKKLDLKLEENIAKRRQDKTQTW